MEAVWIRNVYVVLQYISSLLMMMFLSAPARNGVHSMRREQDEKEIYMPTRSFYSLGLNSFLLLMIQQGLGNCITGAVQKVHIQICNTDL